MNAPTQGLATSKLQHLDGRYVLDPTNDAHAWPALMAYAASCKADDPATAHDLVSQATIAIDAANLFITVPETTLPGGLVVPAFQVAQYYCSKGPMEIIQVNETGTPWVDISYEDAHAACVAIGRPLITETQWLAIAHRIVNRAINWTGGEVGKDKVYQGLRNGSVSEPQPGTYVPNDPDERRWHEIADGVRIHDFTGNVAGLVHDDIQGDDKGIVAGAITLDSPSMATAPYPSREKGMGWRPSSAAKWSGYALVRGGCWGGVDDAGVFGLDVVHPAGAGGHCRLPLHQARIGLWHLVSGQGRRVALPIFRIATKTE